MDDTLPELVDDWKLDATVNDNFTIQIKHISNQATGLWRTQVEERWEPVRKLGQGSFGVVWLEQCTIGPSAGKVRAVKQLQAECGIHKVSHKMLSRELLAIMTFSHSHYRDCFVESFGWYDDPDSIFITMEYMPLGDLEHHIQKPLPEAQTRRITEQILQGLSFMHQSKFAHRDLKPNNILVQHTGPDWWVKISDFGTSKQIKSTVLHTTIGTEHYQAPEVISFYKPSEMDVEDNHVYDLSVDLWAIGAIAFRLVTGRTAFPVRKDLFRYVVYDGPFPVDDSLSANCTDFITKTMSGSPRQRPTADQALKSAWISTSIPSCTLTSPQTSMDSTSLVGRLEANEDASAQWSMSEAPLESRRSIPSAVSDNQVTSGNGIAEIVSQSLSKSGDYEAQDSINQSMFGRSPEMRHGRASNALITNHHISQQTKAHSVNVTDFSPVRTLPVRQDPHGQNIVPQEAAKRFVAFLSHRSDNRLRKDIPAGNCNIVVTPRLLEAFATNDGENNYENDQPILALDLTSRSLVRQSSSVILDIRSTVRSGWIEDKSHSGGDFRFRCTSSDDCYDLYMSVEDARIDHRFSRVESGFKNQQVEKKAHPKWLRTLTSKLTL